MVCPATGLDDALALAEAYRVAVEGIALSQAQGLTYSVSIGVAPAQANHARIEDWIHAADAALYEAKRRGRNCLMVAQGDSIA